MVGILHLFHSYISQAMSSPFASGGLLLMLVGGAAAAARSVPRKIGSFALSRFSTTVRVQQRDPLFKWTSLWLTTQPYTGRCRTLLATTTLRSTLMPIDDSQEVQSRIELTPDRGVHLFRWKKTWILMKRGREEESGSKGMMGHAPPPEEITLRFWTVNRKVIQELLEDVRASFNPPGKPKTHVFVNRYSDWCVANSLPYRTCESVVLPEGELEGLVRDIDEFYKNEDFYDRVGMPYRRGYMFHGEPGTGKTSTLRALASKYGAALYVLSLSESGCTDSSLSSLLSSIHFEKAFVVLEDIDSYFNGRDTRSENIKVTFSGLLNAIDGVGASEGHLLFITTNHREGLDPALVRPGRIDREVQFTYVNQDQMVRMFEKFHPHGEEVEPFLSWCSEQYPDGKVTAAQLQRALSDGIWRRA